MRSAKTALTSRKDVCIFCASKLQGSSPATTRRSITYRRQFQSSTSSSRPPAAAAVAEQEDEEPRPQFRQQPRRTPPPPIPRSDATGWTNPAFESSRLTPKFGQQSLGEGGLLFRSNPSGGAKESLENAAHKDPQDRPAPSTGATPYGHTLSSVQTIRPGRDRRLTFQLSNAGRINSEGPLLPPRGPEGYIPSTRVQPGQFSNNTPSVNSFPSLSSTDRAFSRYERNGTNREPYPSGDGSGADPTQTRPPVLRTHRYGRPDSPRDDRYSTRDGSYTTRENSYRQDSRPPIRNQYRAANPRSASDSTLGLENGWKHLRHTPAKRYRIEQEKREESSKNGAWTGFLNTIPDFQTPAKLAVNTSQDEPTTFKPFFDAGETQRRGSAPNVRDVELSKELPETPIFPPNPERLEDTRRWERKKLRRAEKFTSPDDEDEPDIAKAQVNQRSRYGRTGRRAGVYAKEEDEREDDYEFQQAKARRKQRMREKEERKRQRELESPQPISLPEFISVINLANLMRTRPEAFFNKLEELGFPETTHDHILDAETAGLIAAEFNFEPTVEDPTTADLVAQPAVEDQTGLPPRPPIVTIMGHVDHGKTTLLDYLRKSSVVASEFGGITQHIGAFSVPMPSGKLITFLDTPGHAAFLDMRRRGANMTDIVILVVAADDSVKPQTIEAIKHIREANVATIVAINKIDKEDSNAERVKQDLSREGISVEDYGGDIQAIPVSGKTGQGMLDLEEAAVALSEQLDRRADINGFAEGWVIEATTKASGRVATVLVRRGTLRPGNTIVAGTTWARVRTLKNEAGLVVRSAGPGTPVEVDGWKEQPTAGDEVLQAPSESRAKSAIEVRLEKQERALLTTDISAINDARRLADVEREKTKEAQRESRSLARAAGVRVSRYAQSHDEGWQDVESNKSGIKELSFIAKADVSGSVEAVINSVSALGNAEVRAHMLRSGVGPISSFDVEHAAAAEGHILNFNTTVDPNIARMAEMEGVEILDYNIIYKLVDAVKAKLSDMLEPSVVKKVTGEAEIGQVFDITIKGKEVMAIAGCRVRNGAITRNSKVRVLRGKEIIYDGTVSSLKNIKKDVTEMRKGTECGMAFEGWQGFVAGDQVQCYDQTTEKRYLE